MSPACTDPSRVLHDLPHVRQQYNWDCGVSCVMMLLSEEQQQYILDNLNQICTEEGFGHSTWTIDLCYLLKRYNINHRMYTTMAGVNEEYKNQNYYSKIIDIDRSRILQRFTEASVNGIQVNVQELTVDNIVEHLRDNGPVILLVDASRLACDICKHNKLKSEFRKCFGGSYQGHYILLVGLSGRHILYRDPGLNPRLCAATAASLRYAAATPGTDDDAILIFKDR